MRRRIGLTVYFSVLCLTAGACGGSTAEPSTTTQVGTPPADAAPGASTAPASTTTTSAPSGDDLDIAPAPALEWPDPAPATLWVAHRNGTLYEVNPAAGMVVGQIDTGPLDALETGWLALWGVSCERGLLVEVDLPTRAVTREIPVGACPVDLAFDGTLVWVAVAGDGAVVGVDAGSGEVVQRLEMTEPTALAAGSPLLAGTAGGFLVYVVDGQQRWTRDLGLEVVDTYVSHGPDQLPRLFVLANDPTGLPFIIELDPGTGQTLPTSWDPPIEGPSWLLHDGSHLYVPNQADGAIYLGDSGSGAGWSPGPFVGEAPAATITILPDGTPGIAVTGNDPDGGNVYLFSPDDPNTAFLIHVGSSGVGPITSSPGGTRPCGYSAAMRSAVRDAQRQTAKIAEIFDQGIRHPTSGELIFPSLQDMADWGSEMQNRLVILGIDAGKDGRRISSLIYRAWDARSEAIDHFDDANQATMALLSECDPEQAAELTSRVGAAQARVEELALEAFTAMFEAVQRFKAATGEDPPAADWWRARGANL